MDTVIDDMHTDNRKVKVVPKKSYSKPATKKKPMKKKKPIARKKPMKKKKPNEVVKITTKDVDRKVFKDALMDGYLNDNTPASETSLIDKSTVNPHEQHVMYIAPQSQLHMVNENIPLLSDRGTSQYYNNHTDQKILFGTINPMHGLGPEPKNRESLLEYQQELYDYDKINNFRYPIGMYKYDPKQVTIENTVNY